MRSAFASDVSTSLLSKSKHEMAEMMEMAKKAHTHNHTHTQSNTHTHNQTQALNVMTYSLTTKYGSVLDAIVLLRAYLRLSVVWVCVCVGGKLALACGGWLSFFGIGRDSKWPKTPICTCGRPKKERHQRQEGKPPTRSNNSTCDHFFFFSRLFPACLFSSSVLSFCPPTFKPKQ